MYDMGFVGGGLCAQGSGPVCIQQDIRQIRAFRLHIATDSSDLCHGTTIFADVYANDFLDEDD